MSLNKTIPSPSFGSILPPPGTNFLAIIDSALPFLMIGVSMGSVLVAIFLALLCFSTASMRRKPLFILNVIAVLAGIADAIISVYEMVHTLKSPLIPLSPHVIIAIGTLDGITPILVDSILLLRLYAVYPPRETRRMLFCVIMGVPILVKIARLINTSVYLVNFANNVHALVNTSTGVGGAMVLVTSRLPCVKIEWFFQLFDDFYSSTIFLYRVYRQSAPSRRFSEKNVSQKIKTLFWISTSNFVFPVMLGVVQIAIYLATPNNYLLALYVEEVNFHFTIVGVVFATVWVAEGRWADNHHVKDPSTQFLSDIHFADPRGPQQRNTNTVDLAPSTGIYTSRSMFDVSPAASDVSEVRRSPVQEKPENLIREEEKPGDVEKLV